MELLVLLGLVVRVGDAAVDELRGGGDLAALLDLRGGQNIDTWYIQSSPAARASARCSKGDLSAVRRAWQARRRSRRGAGRCFGDQVARGGPGCTHIRAPWSSAASAAPGDLPDLCSASRRSRGSPRCAPSAAGMSPSIASKSSHEAAVHGLGRRLQRGHLARPGDARRARGVVVGGQARPPPASRCGASRRAGPIPCASSRRRGCSRCSCAGVGEHEQRRAARRDELGRDLADEAGRFDQRDSSAREGARQQR